MHNYEPQYDVFQKKTLRKYHSVFRLFTRNSTNQTKNGLISTQYFFFLEKRHILVISLKHFRHFKERTQKRNNNKVGLLHYKLMIKPWEMMFKKNVKWQKQINTQWSYFKNLGKMFHQTESSIIDDNVFGNYARSPRIRRANWMSFGMIVTRFAWIAHKFVSSNNPTK